jgi:hypothetical protein
MISTMLKKWIIISLIGISTVLTACGAGPVTEIPIPTAVPTEVLTAVASLADMVPPDVATNIQNRVSEILGVPVESIQFRSVEAQEWPNGCLGLPEPDEACTEAITPGWLVVFVADGQEYRFRVDQTGTVIRREP